MDEPTEVYAVEKVRVEKIMGQPVEFRTNEAMYGNEEDAKRYIKLRKAAKDRDDRGCAFKITPWAVQ